MREALQRVGLLPLDPEELNRVIHGDANSRTFVLRADALKRKLERRTRSRASSIRDAARFSVESKDDKAGDGKGCCWKSASFKKRSISEGKRSANTLAFLIPDSIIEPAATKIVFGIDTHAAACMKTSSMRFGRSNASTIRSYSQVN